MKNEITENTREQKTTRTGYWYEPRDGKILFCVRTRVNGGSKVHRFELPVGTRELKLFIENNLRLALKD